MRAGQSHCRKGDALPLIARATDVRCELVHNSSGKSHHGETRRERKPKTQGTQRAHGRWRCATRDRKASCAQAAKKVRQRFLAGSKSRSAAELERMERSCSAANTAVDAW